MDFSRFPSSRAIYLFEDPSSLQLPKLLVDQHPSARYKPWRKTIMHSPILDGLRVSKRNPATWASAR